MKEKMPTAIMILPKSLQYLDISSLNDIGDVESIDAISSSLRIEIERAEWFEIYLKLVNENTPPVRATEIANEYYAEYQKRFDTSTTISHQKV